MVFQAIGNMLNSVLDPILRPVLYLPPFWAILVLSLVIALLISIVYKYVTDQELMRKLKADMKEKQKRMKELKDQPEEMMKVQKQVMETNMQYMKQSFKPTLVTFLPIIIIFSWMSAHLAYAPLHPGEEFSFTVLFEEGVEGNVTLEIPPGLELVNEQTQTIAAREASWMLQGDAGTYDLSFSFQGKRYDAKVILTEEVGTYANPETVVKDGRVRTLTLSNEPLKFLFGLGWLWSYIILSIVFSLLIRKLLKLA